MSWLNFWKKKGAGTRVQREYGLYDVHSHLLWGLDDGAKTMDESIGMIREYAHLGYRGVIATPHVNHRMFETPDDAVVERRLMTMANELEQANLEVKIGAEVMCREEYVAGFEQGRFRGVGDAWLVEFENRPGIFGPALERMVFEFRLAGRTLILAHPERYGDVQNKPELLVSLKERGMIMQINLGSLVGKYGHRARQLAWKFVESEIADVVSTDAHCFGDFRAVEAALTQLAQYDEARFRMLASDNPRFLFEGTPAQIA